MAAPLKRLWHLRGVLDVDQVSAARGAAGMGQGLLQAVVWALFEAARVAVRDAKVLGDDEIVALDAAWYWSDPPGSGGWPLHVDSRVHGTRAVTAWIPLVDVSARNGAIRWSPISGPTPDVRSLEVAEAAAGDVLVWDHETWHCGGRVLEGVRTCCAIELAAVEPAGRGCWPTADLVATQHSADRQQAALQRYTAAYRHMLRAA